MTLILEPCLQGIISERTGSEEPLVGLLDRWWWPGSPAPPDSWEGGGVIGAASAVTQIHLRQKPDWPQWESPGGGDGLVPARKIAGKLASPGGPPPPTAFGEARPVRSSTPTPRYLPNASLSLSSPAPPKWPMTGEEGQRPPVWGSVLLWPRRSASCGDTSGTPIVNLASPDTLGSLSQPRYFLSSSWA